MFGNGKSLEDWARDNGVAVKCPKHNVLHDPMLPCPKCREEANPRRDIFKNIIWPDEKLP